MLGLKDPILAQRPPPGGIELPPLREPDSLETPDPYDPSVAAVVMTSKEFAAARSAALPPVPGFDRFVETVAHNTGPSAEAPSAMMDSRMVLKAVKRTRSFDWVGSRSALPEIVRQMETYGWTVTVREEVPTDHA
jgi:hypothetical protein